MAKTNKTIWRTDDKITQDLATGAGAMSVTFNPDGSCKVLQINLHLNTVSATTENLVITLDAQSGTEYDVNILTRDMNTVKDLILTKKDLDEYIMFGTDKLVFTWSNTDSRTWGLEVIYRRYNS